MWLNPLPGETVIAAIVGAVLSTVMAQFEYYKISVWTDARFPLMLTALVLAFGISIHVYCAATYLGKALIGRVAVTLCIFFLLGLIALNASHPLAITEDGSVQFKPREGNILMAGVMCLWLITLRCLTFVKKYTKDSDEDV